MSTLFPQLPRASLRAFKTALGLAFAAVAGLALGGAYPVAIVLAAVAVPSLVVIYLIDVDLYEDQPWLVTGMTIVWGAGMGVVVALLGRAFVPTAADLLAQSQTETLVEQGVVVPLVALALGLAGPLVLLVYPRFNDVLDGATFGATSAVWLSATQILVLSGSLFTDGVRPIDAGWTWALRLVQLAIAVPLLWAGVGGATAGSFWLRYRGYRGARTFAAMGRPFLSVVVAGAIVVVVSCAQILLALWAAVTVSFVLAGVSLVWLRALVHSGLTEESLSLEIGAEIACANCHRHTPHHAFCGECGVALRALPKTQAGPAQVRFRDRVVLGGFGAAMLLFAGGAAAAMHLGAPEAPERTCDPGLPCGGPPETFATAPLVIGKTWSSGRGERIEYDADAWRVVDEDDERLTLRYGDAVQLEIDVRDEDSPLRLPNQIEVTKKIDLPIPHGPNIGYVHGTGAWHEGYVNSSQAPRSPVTVATLSSRLNGRTFNINAIFYETKGTVLNEAWGGVVDSILNTITWGVSSSGANAAPPRPEAGNGDQPASATTNVPATGLMPGDVASAFNIRPLWTRGYTGKGETVAILSLVSYHPEDVAAFDRQARVPEDAPAVEKVTIGPPPPVNKDSIEPNLDIDVVRAIAPHARILVYEAANTWPNFLALLKRINDDNRASIVSISWGMCMSRMPEEYIGPMQAELLRAREAGRTIFVASGDTGAFSCLHTADSFFDRDAHAETVDWPASSPDVIAVGGTRLMLFDDSTYRSEAAWADALSSGGTGGGVAKSRFRRPGWQNAPEVVNRFSNGDRQVPDVAGPADCDSGFFVVYSEEAVWSPETVIAGPSGCGTSAAAPFWAAVTALVSQYAKDKGVNRLGFLAPTLYEIARSDRYKKVFNDVQVGSNLLHEAGPGWDYATGLGSPKAWPLAQEIVRVRKR